MGSLRQCLQLKHRGQDGRGPHPGPAEPLVIQRLVLARPVQTRQRAVCGQAEIGIVASYDEPVWFVRVHILCHREGLRVARLHQLTDQHDLIVCDGVDFTLAEHVHVYGHCFYRDNARQYALELRKLRAEFDAKVTGADLSKFRSATMHSGYDYILQELGLQVTAVIEPRHGVQPTARQLADTIDRINVAHVNVLFAEKYFASKLSDTIRDATGVEMYSISHISSGPYTPEKFIDEMRDNLDTLAQAINDVAQDAP